MQAENPELVLARLTSQDVDWALGSFLSLIAEVRLYKGGERISGHLWRRFSSLLIPSQTEDPGRNRPEESASAAYVVRDRDEPVALGVLAWPQVSEEENDTEIVGFVNPAFRRRGIGTWLTMQLVEVALSGGARDICYVAAPGARNAKSVGERTGFRARELKMFRVR